MLFLANLKVAWRHNRTEGLLLCVTKTQKHIYIRKYNYETSEITLYCGLCYRPISCFNLLCISCVFDLGSRYLAQPCQLEL